MSYVDEDKIAEELRRVSLVSFNPDAHRILLRKDLLEEFKQRFASPKMMKEWKLFGVTVIPVDGTPERWMLIRIEGKG